MKNYVCNNDHSLAISVVVRAKEVKNEDKKSSLLNRM